ncbi:MAG TPA: immunoglobulin domain-containing protein [Candidatus Dormibacteraeota bacterium]|nr:immunoglobulin domain-containing protein [Candidatus Dormibacteraeota bacterium]
MRTLVSRVPFFLAILITSHAWGTVRYVNQSNPSPAGPYTSWINAATNIQDAVDAASAGDLILVTNGVYAFGGRIMSGDLSNRVAIYKSMTVQSVNGPQVTVIQGAWDAATNGPTSVRCVWLTNNTTLSGFTLQQGATRPYTGSGDIPSTKGAGAYGSSTTATLANCIIRMCFAGGIGGGVFQASVSNSVLAGNHAVGSGQPGFGFGGEGSGGGAANSDLRNCIITNNYAEQSDGGGTISTTLRNCYLAGNSCPMNGGAARSGTLISCTVVSNISSGYSPGYGAAVFGANLTNTLVWNNFSRTTYPNTNYASSFLGYCCSVPLAPGAGNISTDPQLTGDGAHVSFSSPCRNAGLSSMVTGTDIDGQSWSNAPSIGCDEWSTAPVIGFAPITQIAVPAGGVTFNLTSIGQTPFSYTWSKDNAEITNSTQVTDSPSGALVIKNLGPDDAGVYSVVLSNVFGTATQQVAQLHIHAVSAASSSPAAPFTNWASAAATIQDAVNVAAAGDIVLVTNGLYSSGGKAISGSITNRVVIDRPIVVMSVNGFSNTVIQGTWDPLTTTNGPLAVRCAWLTNGATLNGFTLRNGATQARSGFVGAPLETGGGAWCAGSDAIVSNCLLTNNRAIYGGGIGGPLSTFSELIGGTLNNSFVIGNYATDYGGGACSINLNNCTISFNYSGGSSSGGGAYECNARNTIIMYNYYSFPFPQGYDNYRQSSGRKTVAFCCVDPLTSGIGNIDLDPLFIDLSHISGSSPCRAAGSALYCGGVDLDGELWIGNPSIGCDEIIASNLTGPLVLSILASQTNLFVGHFSSFGASVSGHVSRLAWSFGNGAAVTNGGRIVQYIWNAPGDFPLTLTAVNNDYPDGVSTNLMVHVAFPDPVQLTQPTTASNQTQFRFTTQYSATYTVEYATNLAQPVSWKTLQTFFFATGGDYLIKDSGASNAARFYRVRAQ